MAVYKGREVTILGKQGGEDTSPLYTIMHKDGQREDVKMNQIQMTDKEIKDAKDGAAWHLDGAQVIKEADLNDLRSKTSKEEIEKHQKTQKPGPVEVSKVMVDPAEVQDKSTITPQMTTDQRPEKKAK
jgi:hypothetical protein